ncbi:MAG: TraR/DksA family transcriptional regulator, partial [Acidimicrobiales bacterium]
KKAVASKKATAEQATAKKAPLAPRDDTAAVTTDGSEIEAPPAAKSEAQGGSLGGVGLLSHRRKVVERRTEGYVDERWISHQRRSLESERVNYVEQARSLRAEAESLVEEMEPGDIQFDDESGEGGTVTVDRERDLALAAQALQAVDEIDHALAKMAGKSYGICENCGRLIPKPRLEALPFARLCIDCKSGGLSRR